MKILHFQGWLAKPNSPRLQFLEKIIILKSNFVNAILIVLTLFNPRFLFKFNEDIKNLLSKIHVYNGHCKSGCYIMMYKDFVCAKLYPFEITCKTFIGKVLILTMQNPQNPNLMEERFALILYSNTTYFQYF